MPSSLDRCSTSNNKKTKRMQWLRTISKSVPSNHICKKWHLANSHNPWPKKVICHMHVIELIFHHYYQSINCWFPQFSVCTTHMATMRWFTLFQEDKSLIDTSFASHDLQLISCINFYTMGKFKLCGTNDLKSTIEQAIEFQKTQKVFTIESNVSCL